MHILGIDITNRRYLYEEKFLTTETISNYDIVERDDDQVYLSKKCQKLLL